MSASSARSLRRHPKPAAPAPARIPTLLAALVARTQTLDPFAHAWDAYVCAHVDPEELNKE